MAGTRHYSAQRAGGSVVLAALGLTAAAAPLMGLDPWSLLNIETGFALFTASSLAGAGMEGRRLCTSPGVAAGYTCCNQGGSYPSLAAAFCILRLATCGEYLPLARGCCLQG